MEERERQARKGAGAKPSARWLPCIGAAALLAVVVAAAPADGERAPKTSAAPQTITANGTSFSPANVTINQGETVTWRNTGGTHNVVLEGPDGFEFPNPPAPESNTMVWPFTRPFSTPGTWRYYCRPHESAGMEGTVTVVATGAPPNPPPGGGTPPPGGGTPPPGGGTPPPGGGTPPPGGGNPPPGGGGCGGGGGSPGGLAGTTVTLRVSDATPTRGARVRFFGTVRPARDGRLLQLQRRSRGGSYVTVSRIRLRDAGSTRSKFSKRLRVMGDAMFRARLPADRAHEVGVSRTRRLNVP
jgi:plastocyanin